MCTHARAPPRLASCDAPLSPRRFELLRWRVWARRARRRFRADPSVEGHGAGTDGESAVAAVASPLGGVSSWVGGAGEAVTGAGAARGMAGVTVPR